MSLEWQDRRERRRGDDILKQIEDVTYAVLRNRSSHPGSETKELAQAASAGS